VGTVTATLVHHFTCDSFKTCVRLLCAFISSHHCFKIETKNRSGTSLHMGSLLITDSRCSVCDQLLHMSGAVREDIISVVKDVVGSR